MAIIINWSNLQKRYVHIDWVQHEVTKVILNWAEIRPNEQQHVDYHVIWNWIWSWWGWQTPWWWSTSWWWTSWLWYTWWTASYDGLPSLRNARRIKIVYALNWTQQPVDMPVDARLLRWSERQYQSQILSERNQLFWCAHDVIEALIWATPWAYTITSDIDLENKVATQVVEWPNWFYSEIWTYELTTVEVNNIRLCDRFLIDINYWMWLAQTDFYIWNMEIKSLFPLEWFHIPSYNECDNLISICNWLWVWCDAFKIPAVWYLAYTDWNLYWSTYIWTSTAWYEWCYYNMRVWSSYDMNIPLDWRTWYWQTVRPFCDTYYEPDNSWSVIHWQIWWDWVFHNASQWLISAKYWNLILTISDKNLWATDVWNPWEAVTFNNFWWLYQRWNCYWFDPRSPFNKSSAQVDTSGYWWWILYTSDTFVTSHWNWQNPDNPLLWAWNV